MKISSVGVFFFLMVITHAIPRKNGGIAHRQADGNILDRIEEVLMQLKTEVAELRKDVQLRTPFPVRLVNNGTVNETAGWLEVFANGEWGLVCDNYKTGWNTGSSNSDLTDNNAAIVVCRMLGKSGGEVVVDDQEKRFGKSQIRHIQLTNVRCAGDEESIFDCPMKVDVTESEEGCNLTDYLGIVCS